MPASTYYITKRELSQYCQGGLKLQKTLGKSKGMLLIMTVGFNYLNKKGVISRFRETTPLFDLHIFVFCSNTALLS